MNDVFKRYQEFVNGVTSEDSLSTDAFLTRIQELEKVIPFAKMDTACSGVAGEAGEINDLWKKVKFHGKPWNEDNRNKMMDELGDMFWYLSHLMECLETNPEEIIKRNIHKLESRYPGGKFSIERSENRDRESDPTYEE